MPQPNPFEDLLDRPDEKPNPFADLLPAKPAAPTAPAVTEESAEEPGRATRMPSTAGQWGRFMLGGMLSPIKQTETAIEQTAIQLGLADPGSRLLWRPSEAMERKFFAPIPKIPKQEGTAAQIGAGLVNAVTDFVDFFQTPEGIGTFGLGRIPAVARKAILGDFALKMATEAPEQFKQGYEAAKEGKYQEATEKLLGGAGAVALTTAIGRTMASPGAAHPSVTLPRSLEALGEVPEYAGLGLRNIPFPGEPLQIPYRVPSSLEPGVLQPAGAATVVVDPAGRALPFGQLSPLEQTEAMRGPREFTPREEQVRPAQAAPVVIGEPASKASVPVMVTAAMEQNLRAKGWTQKDIDKMTPSEAWKNLEGEIVPATQAATSPRLTEAGGEVSFGASAQAGAIPSARQAAIEAAAEPLPESPRVIGQVTQIINSKDRTGLQELRDSISGPKAQEPGVGVARANAGDLLRLIDNRLEELRSGKDNPELSFLRRVVSGPKPQAPTQVEILPTEPKQIGPGESPPPEKPISAGAETGTAPPAASTAQEPVSAPAQPAPSTAGELPPVKPGPEETPRSPQALGVTNPQVQAAVDALDTLRQKTVNAWRTRPIKQIAAATKDAADNQSRILGDNISTGIKLQARRLFGDSAPQALDAVYPAIESGGDIARLNQFITQSTGVAGGLRARRAAEFAAANWQRMQPLVSRVKADLQDQLARELAAGIETPERENYIPHIFDTDKLPNRGAEFFAGPGGSGGGGGRFRAARTFNTIYDAIQAGYGDAIKSLNAADITGARVRNGAKRVQDSAWADIFRSVEDPTTTEPLIADVRVDRNGQRIAPGGYELLELFPGRTVAVHKGYSAFFDALTSRSKVEAFEALGMPVGKMALQTEAAIKHGMLLFDSFHASRVMQKAVFLAPKHFGPQLADIPGFAKRGRTLLEYSDRDLSEAVRQDEITREMADYAGANRPTSNLLVRQGLNVGQIHEALRSSIIKDLPVVGTFNRWVFEKVTRGAIMEGGLIEFERIKRNNPTWTDERVANKVVKDINAQFGNLGRQGIFTSASSRDLARLMFLAPQWVESMARSESYGAAQMAKAPFQGQIGTLGKTMATGFGAYFVGAQILNMITRGKPTWQNDEEGHKLDAWIPDVTGKTPGFFLSPLSVPAELTHDVIRYANKKEGAREVGMQIIRNKLSPLGRAAWTMASGRNYADYKIGNTWETAKEAAISLAPVPIPLTGAFKGYPGQTQRQLFGSAGIKIEPAESAITQIREKAAKFKSSQPDAAPDEGHFDPYVDSGYSNLRLALKSKDEEQVVDAIAKLRKGRSDADIQKAMLRSVKIPFTGKRSLEKQFRQSLSDKEQALYDAAIEERLENLDLFLKIWGDRPEK